MLGGSVQYDDDGEVTPVEVTEGEADDAEGGGPSRKTIGC